MLRLKVSRSWRIVFAALMSLLCMSLVVAQDSNAVQLHIFDVDSDQYPVITSSFNLFDTATGRVPEVNQNNITVTYGGEILPISNLTPDDSNARRLNVVLCIDLTDSNIESFIEEQKRTAQKIFDTLNSSDYLGIVVFSDQKAEVLRPLSPFNQNDISAIIPNLDKVRGQSNTFFDALTLATAEFGKVDASPDQTNAVILMTDVERPDGMAIRDKTFTLEQQQEQIIKDAQAAAVRLFIIGYGNAQAQVLQPYGAPTFGFTYLQSQLDNEFDQVANFILTGLNREYKVTVEASASANNAAQTLSIQYRNGSVTTSGRQDDVKAVSRPINVTFDNIQPGQAYSDEIRFDPQIYYANTQEKPDLRFVEYRLARTPVGDSDTLLRPTDSLDTTLSWAVQDKQEGSYVVKLTVRDQVGNEGVGQAEFQVSQALEVRFFNPGAPADTVSRYDFPAQKENEIFARVLSKEFEILDVVLRVQKPNGDPDIIEMPMTRFVAVPDNATAEAVPEVLQQDNQALSDEEGLYNIRQTYHVVLDSSELLPQDYILSVTAKDSRQNIAYADARVNVILSEDNTNNASVNIFILLLLFLVIVAIVGAVTYTRNTRDARERRLKEAEEARQQQERAAIAPFISPGAASTGRMGYLIVQAGKPPMGKDVYTLYPNKRHLLGRSQTNDITLIGLAASRNHAEISGDTNGLYSIRDLYPDKGNFTFVNGQPLRGVYTLGEGNVIKIGDTVLSFTYQSPK